MIIGIDLDETISALPQWFAIVTRALVNDGHEVHVITYREPGTEDGVRKELAAHAITYTAIHLPKDHVLPPAWKAGVAKELGLDLMIEDSPEVLAAMPNGTARMWLCDPEVFDLESCLRVL